jgi:hypothetical protein
MVNASGETVNRKRSADAAPVRIGGYAAIDDQLG